MAAKRKIHFMNSDLSIPRTFIGRWILFSKKHRLFFSHLSNLAVTIEFTGFFLAHAQDIVGIIAILFFSR